MSSVTVALDVNFDTCMISTPIRTQHRVKCYKIITDFAGISTIKYIYIYTQIAPYLNGQSIASASHRSIGWTSAGGPIADDDEFFSIVPFCMFVCCCFSRRFVILKCNLSFLYTT